VGIFQTFLKIAERRVNTGIAAGTGEVGPTAAYKGK